MDDDAIYYGEVFSSWLDELETDVIVGEFGYEPGEFTVYANDWFPLFQEGLTPQAAWQRALDAFAEERRREDVKRKARWERIQAEDAKIRASADGGG